MALRALTRQASRPAPRVPAVANASAPQARVAIQRLYGCGAVMMASSSSRACDGDTWPARIRPIRRSTAASRLKSIDRDCTMCSVLAARRRRPTVCGDVDRRVDDVDLATLDAVRGGDGRHLVHRGGRRHSGRHQDGADTPGQIEHLADPRVVGVVALGALRIRYPRQAVRRWLGFPNDSAQDLAMTCPPRLARAITGQLHSTPLLSHRRTQTFATSKCRRLFPSVA